MNENAVLPKELLKNEVTTKNVTTESKTTRSTYELCRKSKSMNITITDQISFVNTELKPCQKCTTNDGIQSIKLEHAPKPKKLPYRCVSGITTNLMDINTEFIKNILKNEAPTMNIPEVLKSKPNVYELRRTNNSLDIPKLNEVIFESTTLQSSQNCTPSDGSQSNKSNGDCKPKKLDLQNNVVVQKFNPSNLVNYITQPLAPLRVGKKLLVVDLDRTLCDFCSPPVKKIRFDESRPYLSNFMCTTYEYYDIVIWSATKECVIMDKMHKLELFSRQSKILSYLDIRNMKKITIRANNKLREVSVKPLELVWNQIGWYNSKNTLIIDDKSINFVLNPKNGLKIKPYLRSNFKTDNELVPLAKYLVALAKTCSDFTTVNHKNWKLYKPNK